MINYRVEVVQTNVFYIEAESPDQARDIATIDHIWDEYQTGKNSYDVGFNITEEQKAGEDFCQACEEGTCNEY